MNTKNMRISRYLAIWLLAVIVASSHIHFANAGVLGRFKLSGSEIFVSNFSQGNELAYLISNGATVPSQPSQDKNQIILGASFLVANHSPAEIQKPKIDIPVKIVRELVVPTTAYSSTPDQTDNSPFVTALGTQVRDGIVAANFLPFGTKIRIPQVFGDKIFVVEDRMNKRYNQRIDIWFPERESALNFGIKNLKVEVL